MKNKLINPSNVNTRKAQLLGKCQSSEADKTKEYEKTLQRFWLWAIFPYINKTLNIKSNIKVLLSSKI